MTGKVLTQKDIEAADGCHCGNIALSPEDLRATVDCIAQLKKENDRLQREVKRMLDSVKSADKNVARASALIDQYMKDIEQLKTVMALTKR